MVGTLLKAFVLFTCVCMFLLSLFVVLPTYFTSPLNVESNAIICAVISVCIGVVGTFKMRKYV